MKCFFKELCATFHLVVDACNVFDRFPTIPCGPGVVPMIPNRDLWLVNKRPQEPWISDSVSLSLSALLYLHLSFLFCCDLSRSPRKQSAEIQCVFHQKKGLFTIILLGNCTKLDFSLTLPSDQVEKHQNFFKDLDSKCSSINLTLYRLLLVFSCEL